MAIPPVNDPRFGYLPPTAGDLSATGQENHASLMGAASGAMKGLSYGKYFGGVGAPIGAGIGALAGALKARTNDTKNQRETFARSLGVNDTTALWQKLASALPPDAANELQHRALNRIGKHDATANQQWMTDVQAALSQASQTAQAPAQNPRTGLAADPSQSAFVSGLRDRGTNLRDLLIARLRGGQ